MVSVNLSKHWCLVVNEFEGVDRKVSWTEVFSDLIFATVVTYLGQDIRAVAQGSGWTNIEYVPYVFKFLALWHVWYSQTLYSTWFNTDDLFHKLYAASYMMAAIGVGAHAKGK